MAAVTCGVTGCVQCPENLEYQTFRCHIVANAGNEYRITWHGSLRPFPNPDCAYCVRNTVDYGPRSYSISIISLPSPSKMGKMMEIIGAMKETGMHDFDYKKKPLQCLTPEIVGMIASIHENKGRQELFIEANMDELSTLLDVAKIQSTGASNRIEGIYDSGVTTRFCELFCRNS